MEDYPRTIEKFERRRLRPLDSITEDKRATTWERISERREIRAE